MKKLLLLLCTCITGLATAQICTPNTSSLICSASSWATLNTEVNLEITGPLTVEAWVYATQWQSIPSSGTIFCKHSWTSGSQQGYVLRAGGSGQLSFNFEGIDSLGSHTGWQELLSATGALTLNTWYHVAGTFDGDTMRLFINGNQVASRSFHGTIASGSAYTPKIGHLCDGGVGQLRNWYGNIDEVRVWNVARTGAELLANYHSHIDPAVQTGLVGYWRLNDATGTTVTDLSTSGNNGTITGAGFNTSNVPFNQSAAAPLLVPNGNLLTCYPANYSGYQWSYNGVPITGATASTYSAPANGLYSVTVTDSLGCTNVSNGYWVTSVGVQEIATGRTPAIVQYETQFFLINPTGTCIDRIDLYDATGKLLSSDQHLSGARIQLHLYDQLKGLCIARIVSAGATFHQSFLVR